MKDLAEYLGKFLADGIDRTHDAGLPMDFTAKGLAGVIKIGLGDYESKLKQSHEKLVELLQVAACPNSCIRGRIMHTDTPEECIFCSMTEQALKAAGEIK